MVKSERVKVQLVAVFLKLLSVVVLLAAFTGCAGGFGTDSNNYDDLKETIFGPDSL